MEVIDGGQLSGVSSEKGQAVQGSSVYVAFQDHNFYADEEKKRAFFYINTTLPIFRQSDSIGLKKSDSSACTE